MYAVNNDTVNQCMAEIGALKDAQIHLGATQSLLRAHPDIEDVDPAKIEDLLCEVGAEIREREKAINEFECPRRFEPEFTERYP